MSLSSQVISGFKWVAFAKFSAQLVTWIFTIYVMRLLNPVDYGLMALAMIFINLLLLVRDFGLGLAIVQHKEINDEIVRKVFGLLILLNIGLYIFIYASSPLIANFFDEPNLTPILQILALQFLLIPVDAIPNALLQKNLQFKKQAIVEVSSSVIGGGVTLGFAFNGFGVWSLVYGAMTIAVVRAIMLNVYCHWLKVPSFRFQGLRKIISFGGYLTLGQMLWFFYSQADSFIAGKILGTAALGIYAVAVHLSSLPMQKINGIINQVAFPAFSKVQGDKQKIQYYMLKAVDQMSFVSFPVFFGIAAVAAEGILLVLGDKWQEAIFPVIILSLIMPLRMISNLATTVAEGCGRADICFGNVAIASVIMPVSFLIGTQWGLTGLCLAWIISFPLVFVIEATRIKVVTDVGVLTILNTIKIPFFNSVMMFGSVFVVSYLMEGLPVILMLTCEILVGGAIYLLATLMFNKDSLNSMMKMVRAK